MNKISSVAVVGLGKLGACLASALSQCGFDVLGTDCDGRVVEQINSGCHQSHEPDLDLSGVIATTHIEEAAYRDASFLVVPTPTLPNGLFSNQYLLDAALGVSGGLKANQRKQHLFVIVSTTTPGSIESEIIPAIEHATGWTCGCQFGLCYNPEFIALGNVMRGLLQPDLVLIGQFDALSGERLAALYDRLMGTTANTAPVFRMSIVSAELAKISLNSFLTMKISFTNQTAAIARAIKGCDPWQVLRAVGADSRVGPKYLGCGLAYGGPCFPRDNRMLAALARGLGVEAPLAAASDAVNNQANEDLARAVLALAGPSDTVAILGTAYKPGTAVTDQSPGMILAQHCNGRVAKVLVHDPIAVTCAFETFNLGQLAFMEEVKVAVICTPHPQYAGLSVSPKTALLNPWGV